MTGLLAWQRPRSCIVCGAEYMPNGPKQKMCSDECRRQRLRDRDRERKEGKYIEGPRPAEQRRTQRFAGGPLPTPVAGAIGDVILHMNKSAVTLPALTLPGLGAVVKHVVLGIRSKDRDLYEEALRELALWAILNLSRVRTKPEDRA